MPSGLDVHIPYWSSWVQVLTPLPILPFCARVSWEAADNGWDRWVPVTPVGGLNRIPGSWLHHGEAPAGADICAVNKKMGTLSLEVSVST